MLSLKKRNLAVNAELTLSGQSTTKVYFSYNVRITVAIISTMKAYKLKDSWYTIV